ncbi:hypothetical protein FSP39_021684 [Pinctada imbricata]|uniref:Uncharacterized protein n=1 Tax=Pinctada imbricata TaxID=66713 RepID=A0AA88XSQ1_PINIB|nr:hypothetical protein FSP39_021684 [Pinctada imbricata]
MFVNGDREKYTSLIKIDYWSCTQEEIERLKQNQVQKVPLAANNTSTSEQPSMCMSEVKDQRAKKTVSFMELSADKLMEEEEKNCKQQ